LYLRTKEDALDAIAVILRLPERRVQIIESTMRIALCLDPAPRQFLMDCQAALIQGGLEELRKRRRDQPAALAARYKPAEPAAAVAEFEEVAEEAQPVAAKAEEVLIGADSEKELDETDMIPIVEPPDLPSFESAEPEVEEEELEEITAPPEPAPLTPERLLDPLLEEVGTAMDVLKVVDIGFEAFPGLRENRETWEIARHFLNHEQEVRARIVEALRNREDESTVRSLANAIVSKMNADKPWWGEWVGSLRETCRTAVTTMRRFHKAHPDADDPELLFNIIAMSEERARELLDMVTKSPAQALSYISEIRTRVDWILSAAEQEK
jgi:hypothetical protein